MVGRRRYHDACAVAFALDLVGERWALLVVRELLLGPKRFSDLRAALPGISADVLTQRLRGLSEHGVIRHRRLPLPAASEVYELTSWGAELDEAVMALARWSNRSDEMAERRHWPISIDSLALSLRVRFDPEAATKLRVHLRLVVDDVPFDLKVVDRTLSVARAVGPMDVRSSSVRLTQATLLALISGRSAFDDELAAGHLTLDDDEGTFRRVLATLRPDPT